MTSIEEVDRYAVVSYGHYYPEGFEKDVEGRFKTIDDAKLFILDNGLTKGIFVDCIYIFDVIKWEKVWDIEETLD